MFGKNKMAMIVAEFLGAGILSVVVYSMIARTSFPLFSGLAAGLTLAMLVLVFGNVSGGHANPAITLGLWSQRKVPSAQAVVYIAAQMLGGVAAWTLLKYFLGHSLDSMAGNKFEWKVVIAEGIGTAIFVFGVVAANYQKYEGGKLAAAVGSSVFIGVLVASMASNALLNPAVAVGVQSWNWAYAAGPLIGAGVGANLYGMLFAPSAPKTSTRKKR